MLAVPVDHTDHVLGAATASVTVVEYADFECPYCRQAYTAVKIIRKHFGDRLRFVFRHFPLVAWHSHAEMAAEASEAVGAQRHFWAMHDRLFEGHEGLDAATLRRHAAALGIDLARFDSEMKDRVWLQRIREHQDGGVRSQVRSTPTFFVNGELRDVSFGMQALETAIEQRIRA